MRRASWSCDGLLGIELQPTSLGVFVDVEETHALRTPGHAGADGSLEKQGESFYSQKRLGLLLGFLSRFWLAGFVRVLRRWVVTIVTFHPR